MLVLILKTRLCISSIDTLVIDPPTPYFVFLHKLCGVWVCVCVWGGGHLKSLDGGVFFSLSKTKNTRAKVSGMD